MPCFFRLDEITFSPHDPIHVGFWGVAAETVAETTMASSLASRGSPGVEGFLGRA